jgi:methylglutaconyl-CoA hydratase
MARKINMNDFGNVTIKLNAGVAEIIFYHPKSNSLPGKLLKEIADAFSKLGDHESTKVIILKSEGEKSFCAGASFDELAAIDNYEDGKEFFMGFARVINAMRKCPQFIIGRIQGKVVGGGVGLASAADYTMAVNSASAKLSELNLGIGPFVVGPAVERKIGKSAFSEMSIDYDWKTAQWCCQKGLYTKLFETTIDLDRSIYLLAEKLAAGSQTAMTDLKKNLWQDTEDWDELLEKRAEISGRLVLSQFTKDFINKFKNV